MKRNALLLFLVPLSASPQDPQDFRITDETISSTLAEVRPLVEKATGRRFEPVPAARIATRDELSEAFGEELPWMLRLWFPAADAAELEDLAKGIARLYASSFLAKYVPEQDAILVVPENFRDQAGFLRKPRINSAPTLRLILIHELVHAADDQAFAPFTRRRGSVHTDTLLVWNALIEGHAQHVEGRVAQDRGEQDLFRELEEAIGAAPSAAGEGEKQLLALFTNNLRFTYIDGRRFFDHLATLQKETYAADVFEKPPGSKDTILHPERYYAPLERPAEPDLAPLWEEIKKGCPGWNAAVTTIGKVDLRAGFGDFVDQKDVDAAIPHLLSGKNLVLTSPESPPSTMIVTCVYRMDDVSRASHLYDLSLALLKSKDERMKDEAIRIAESSYGTLPDRDTKHTLCRKGVSAYGQKIHVAVVIASLEDFVVEITHSAAEEPDEAVMSESLKRVASFLEGLQ